MDSIPPRWTRSRSRFHHRDITRSVVGRKLNMTTQTLTQGIGKEWPKTHGTENEAFRRIC